MADEQQFIEDGLQRASIDEFFADELGRAGYGGMDIAKTPMGTQIQLRAEKPGMVIGKGGKNIRKITAELEERFEMDDPQIDVQEVDEPDLNAQIVADRLANALERGWYFRKAGHTTIDRIMEAGALGAEIVLSGKVTGARSRVEKFNRGYIKHNGQPAREVVDEGQGVAVMKLGTIGVTVKIIPPGAELPDDFRVAEGVEPPEVEVAEEEGVEALLDEPEGEPPTADADAEADAAGDGLAGLNEAAVGADEEPVKVPDEEPAEVVDEAVAEEVGGGSSDGSDGSDGSGEDDASDGPAAFEELDEDVESEAADLVAEMEEAGGGDDDGDEDGDGEGAE
jgi:small subunit ribosomal protein S3